MSLNLDVVKALSVMSEDDWMTFDEIQERSGIKNDRLALILLYGVKKKAYVFNYNNGGWSINPFYQPGRLQRLLYADFSFKKITLNDLEFYDLVDRISDSIVSDKVYAEFEKKKRRNNPPESEQVPKAQFTIKTPAREHKLPSELFASPKKLSIGRLYFKKGGRQIARQPNPANANKSAYTGKKANNPALKLKQTLKDASSYRAKNSLDGVDRGALK